MALAYNRITEEQDQMRNVLDKGEYPFHIKSVAEKPTKKGTNKMLEVELGILDLNGREMTVKDWIILDMDDMAWKLRHFAATLGLLDRYEDDLLEIRDLLGKNGVARLSIAEYERDGEIRKINRVTDYVKPGQTKGNPTKTTAKKQGNEPFFDDADIGF